MDDCKPNVPRYNIAHILSQTDKLVRESEWVVGKRLTGEVYDQFIASIYTELLRCGAGTEKIVADSCRDVLGKQMDSKMLSSICWRLAGNLEELKNFREVPAWSGQSADEWMPVEIVDHRVVPGAKRVSYSFTFRILAGSASALLCRKVWTKKFCHFVSRRLGFSRPDKAHPFKDPAQFVGLRLFGLFEREQGSLHTGPIFDKIYVPSGSAGYNKIVIAKRDRTFPGFSCPAGFKHACHLCFVGYDRCDLGTHPSTYEEKHCPECQQMSWFDTRDKKTHKCVNCARSMEHRTKRTDV